MNKRALVAAVTATAGMLIWGGLLFFGRSPSPAVAAAAERQATRLFAATIESPGIGNCSADRVLVSPGGIAAVTWTEPEPDSLARPDFAFASAEADLVRFSGAPGRAARAALRTAGGRLIPLTFSADGEHLFVLRGGSELYRVSTADASVSMPHEVPSVWGRIQFTTLRIGDPETLLDGDAADKARSLVESGEHRSVLATLAPDEARFLLVPSDIAANALIEDAGQQRDSGMPPMLLRKAALLRENGRLNLYSLGLAGAGASGGYARPLIDVASGRRIGWFDLDRIVASEPAAGAAAREVLRLSGPSIFIADASVSDGSIALLYRNTAGTLLLAYSGRAGSGVVPLCDEARVAAARAYADAHRLGTIFQVPEQPLPALRSPAKERIESREISFSTYGARSGAFGTLLAHSARRRRGLVVYFHGGPSRSELDGAAGLPSAQLALTESDFLSVEYSGSSAGGPTLATALARRGPAALEEDAHAIARWVKAAGYRRIHVIGASFGSVPALAMLAQRQPGLASVSLVTPLLAYGSAEQVEARRDPHPGEWMKWRLEFDHRSFGGSVGDRRLATWLRLRSGALRDPRVRFYLAAKDPLVSPCDLPGSVPAERVAVFNATHQSISALPEFWARLAKDIAGSGATHHGLSRNMTHVSGTPARNSKLLQRCMSGGRDAAGKQRG